ncbi:MAG TPA: type IV pilus secretin PilQ, partial [Candidatus Polarisedimenticolaceae bacterium]|nr:type IV pilus secretin PilQ [Candidatus Polarisedimenticolaceae bacterium]
MSKQWKWTLAAAVSLALFVVASPALSGWASPDHSAETNWAELARLPERNLLDLRIDAGDEGLPTVTLDADGEVEFESFVLDGPDRLVIDLPGVVNRLETQRFGVEQGGVVRIRAGQHTLEPAPVVRVVFDLVEPIPYRIDQVGSSIVVVFGDRRDDRSASTTEGSEPASAVPAEPIVVRPDGAGDARPAAVEVPTAQAEAATSESADEIAAELEARVPEPGPEPVAAEATTTTSSSRSVDPDAIDELLNAPSFAAPQQQPDSSTRTFSSQRITTDQVTYRGKRISLNLVDADIKQVFRLFHEISGLNFVLDPDVAGRVTIVLDQVPWDQALDIILKNNGLDKVLDNNVLRIATTNKLAMEAASRKRLKEAEELEVEPVTLTRTLSYARSRDVEQVIRQGGVLSDRGRVIVDERTNTLIISDIPKKVEPLDALIDTLDAETPQVMIEARIVETSKQYARDLGIIWGFEAQANASHGTSTGINALHNTTLRYGLNLPGDGGASQLGFSFGNIVDSFTLDLALNALETEGRGRIISAPKIATQNNERAEIEQGVRIPVTNTTATEIQVEFVSASLLLSVTPQITAEGTIVLDVTVENNSPDFVNTAGGIPSIRTQRAQTKVLISDGGTTVIGGIFVVNEGDSEVGVPWFRKLPVFGWLFRQ